MTTSCSGLSADLDEPLAGTATEALAWLLVEQPGPWGRSALFESRLDPRLGAELERRCSQAGVKILLVKRYARRGETRRRAFLASSLPDSTFLEEVLFEHPEELLELDLALLATGRPSGAGTTLEKPLYLVCTNGKRDACCARLGRPIAEAVEASRPGSVWECSHTGGHRFAGVLICLPDGLCFGRVSAETALLIVESYERRRIETRWFRGRSSFSGAAQAADVYLRAREDITGIDELVVSEDGSDEVVLSRDDGTRFLARVRQEAARTARPTSCREIGEEGKRPPFWALESIERL